VWNAWAKSLQATKASLVYHTKSYPVKQKPKIYKVGSECVSGVSTKYVAMITYELNNTLIS